MSFSRVVGAIMSALLALTLTLSLAPAASAAAAPQLLAVYAGGPDLDTVVTVWDQDISAADATKFEVYDTAAAPALVTSGATAGVSSDPTRVVVTLAAALTAAANYQLKVLAGGVTDSTDSNADTALSAFTADQTAPPLSSAVVDSDTLTLEYGEALDPTSVPATGNFAVSEDGGSVTVSSVAVADGTVTLTLAAAVTEGAAVTVDYTVPASNGLRDQIGNAAAGLTAQTVTNNTDTAPQFTDAEVDGDMVTLTYDQDLDTASVPGGSAFSADVDGSLVAAVAESVVVFANTASFTLATDAGETSVVTVNYTVPETNPLRDGTGNLAAALTGQAVTNVTDTPPTLQEALVDGATLTLVYDELIDAESVPAATDFALTVDSAPASIAGVSVDGSNVVLALSTPVADGAAVSLTYTAPSANPIQDLTGNDAAGFTDLTVVNVTDTTAPVLVGLWLHDDVLQVVYGNDDVLDTSSTPAAGDFTVTVDGATATIASVGFDWHVVVLTLAEPVTPGAVVTLSYAPGSNPIQDLAGNAAAPITNEPVDNFTQTRAVFPSAEPLSIEVGGGLDCQILYDSRQLFYGDSACGTFAYVGGVLYGPSVPAGPTTEPFAAVSQSDVTGAGTEAEPYTVTTVVDAGTTGVRITQVDTYVDGTDSTTSTITVDNTGGTDVPVVLYRAADCMVNGEDGGFGSVDAPTGSVSCIEADITGETPVPGTGFVQFTPGTVGARYEAAYDDVWATLESGASFDNTCTCDTYVDNGMGLSWAFTVPSGGQLTHDVHTVALLDVDTAAPVLEFAYVDGDRLVLLYSEPLDSAAVPAVTAWTVTGSDSAGVEVAAAGISGSVVELTLAALVTADEAVAVSYDATVSNAIRDSAGNVAASLTDAGAENWSRPALTGGDVDGDIVTLGYDEELDAASVPATSTYAVALNGADPVAVSAVDVLFDEVVLTLAQAVDPADAVTLTYTVPGSGAVEDLQGYEAVGFVDEPLENSTPLPDIDCVPSSVNSQLTNMGFEAGDLSGWSTGDVRDTITATQADGFETPWEGTWMGRLGSTYSSAEEAQPQGPNELCQDFIVTAETEQFAYNIYTYDYTGFDRFAFHLTVTDPATGEVLAAHEQDSWGVGGDTSLKTSGWQGVTLDLADHIGETVRLGFSAGSTQDDLFGFWVYLDSAVSATPEPVTPVADTESSTGSTSTDPQTGQVTVSMPLAEPSDLTLSTTVTCDGALTQVRMLFAGTPYDMTAVDGQPGKYTVTISAADISAASGGSLVVTYTCDTVQTVNQAGQIVLYDPSGIVTDAVTGVPVVGASVHLYKVAGWTAKDADGVGDCESNLSKPEGQAWSQPAPTGLGQLVSASSPEISPNVNPFITNAIGYYGWDVTAGCWYVTVAKEGYETLTSPVVGVPPEVTDLHLQLTPKPASGGGGGGGGAKPAPTPTPTVPEGAAVKTVTPDSAGTSTVTLSLPAGLVSVALDGLTGTGQLTVQQLEETPLNISEFVPFGTGFDVTLTGAQFRGATVCLPLDASALRSSGATRQEAQMLHKDGRRFEDVTTSVTSRAVCGHSSSFSAFAVGVERNRRVGGADRVATAAAVAAARFAEGTSTVYLATADVFADALTAGPAAAQADGPLLLTSGGRLSDATVAELDRLQAQRVIVLGGPAAVPVSVETQLAALGLGVTRVAGPDRYATAAAVSAATFKPGAREVFIATGEDFPDALAGGSAAARRGAPVLLVRRDSVPAVVTDELARLNPGKMTIVGGTAAVSDTVATQLAAFTGGDVSRLSGPDRYATAAAVSARYFSGGGSVFVATGANFADALAGVPAAALTGSPLLLVDANRVPVPIRAELRRLDAARSVILGRGAAISEAVGTEVGGLVG